jgi:chromosome segregation ATPase
MEDTATKIKNLTANLQEAQAKVTKKKEEIENKTKQLKEIEGKNVELAYVLDMKRAEFMLKTDTLAKEKETKKKAIEELKAVLASDKDSLQKQKEELLAKLKKTEEEATSLEG